MTAAFVQTSGPVSAHDVSDDLHITITAVLVNPAEVRSKPVGDGSHVRPVLCLDVSPLNKSLRRRIHVEQIYTEATRKEAEARAALFKRGMQITFTTTLTDMRVLFPHVRSIALTPSPAL